MHWYGADLHIHSALSACAEDEMAPRGIAAAVRDAGIHIAAVTDHNSCQNCAAVAVALRARGVVPLFGMELETVEEVHVLCLLPDLTAAAAWQDYVYARLPAVPLDPRVFREQRYFGVDGHLAGKVGRLLGRASEITLDVAAKEVRRLGGVAIPAHVDRPAYSVTSVLGFVPPDLGIAAVEVSTYADVAAVRRAAGLEGFTVVSFSDAHRLADILPARTAFCLAEPTFDEICLALSNEAGRRTVVID